MPEEGSPSGLKSKEIISSAVFEGFLDAPT